MIWRRTGIVIGPVGSSRCRTGAAVFFSGCEYWLVAVAAESVPSTPPTRPRTMAKLEELTIGARVRGLTPHGVATIKAVTWFGDQGVQVIYEPEGGGVADLLVYRDDEPRLSLDAKARAWSFDADPDLFRLVSEAQRIKLAWQFDPYLAITTSSIEPLPHQISAVYEEMLPRQPMRFLLADDPGAGKTIMAGLLIKELIVRGDLQRCLIVSPGSLTEQWQDELWDKFELDFELLSRGMIDASRTANPFEEKNLLIARLDQLSRNEDVVERLKAAPEWDLIVCDEAHRMSAHYSGGEVQYTGRYRLGQKLAERCRNLLLMTATPHNGHEDDFQLFLALLDGDRFEGRFRDGVHTSDPSDMMRRLVKEDLYTFESKKLFPERKSYTVQYDLSSDETLLYTEVTKYVREEMNRAERLAAQQGDHTRRVNVGFALMTLQRRLASSPEAILKSITRRRERLESRLREERLAMRGAALKHTAPQLTDAEWDELDEESPQDEREEVEQQLTDNATAAQTINELGIEITTLKDLEQLAKRVRHSGLDAKWSELTQVLDDAKMKDQNGHRRKLVIFTEFRDTLEYLAERIRTKIGDRDAVVEIHGGIAREARRGVVHAFMNNPSVVVLVANDAAGEGVNLQRAHLMVNYDLPWNPNRLEQRFGRIHRIGQEEVCHLWNLIAKDTREGDVYVRLLQKLEKESAALKGKVFDVLGQLFEKRPLRELLVDAILYGDDPKRREELDRQVDGVVDHAHIQELLERRGLVAGREMDLTKIHAIHGDMERARARRLQPHFVEAFFRQAFEGLGGKMHRREPGRFEVTHVPQPIRERDRLIGTGAPVLKQYERVCFDKPFIAAQPRALLVCPGSPLLDSTIDLVLERHRGLLKQGAILVDEHDAGTRPRMLFYLEHEVQDGRRTQRGEFQCISKRLQFVEVDETGKFRDAGMAPYLDYRGASDGERSALTPVVEGEWLKKEWEHDVMGFALRDLVPPHVAEVKRQRLALLDKVEGEVRARLQKEINYWDHRAEDLKAQESAGKKTKLPWQNARDRAERLADRLRARLDSLKAERAISPRPPRVVGGALVVSAGLLRKLGVALGPDGAPLPGTQDTEEKRVVERLAIEAVMAAERRLGRLPKDVGELKLGHDVESTNPHTGDVYFIEVKGRADDADNVVLTKNEVLRALNVPDRFRLAIVLVKNAVAAEPVYVEAFDWGQPGWAQTHSTYRLDALLKKGAPPR
jgi:superfamily II DNA or RNA helicase